MAGPAWAFAVLMVVVHGVGLSIVAGRTLGVSAGTMVGPLLRPLLAAALCSPILVAGEIMIDRWGVWELIAVLGGYGVAYAACVLVFGITRSERALVLGTLKRRLRRSEKARIPSSAVFENRHD
jgi:hypothetical protein